MDAANKVTIKATGRRKLPGQREGAGMDVEFHPVGHASQEACAGMIPAPVEREYRQ